MKLHSHKPLAPKPGHFRHMGNTYQTIDCQYNKRHMMILSSVFNIRVDEQRVHFRVDVFYHDSKAVERTSPMFVPSWACRNITKSKDSNTKILLLWRNMWSL